MNDQTVINMLANYRAEERAKIWAEAACIVRNGVLPNDSSEIKEFAEELAKVFDQKSNPK